MKIYMITGTLGSGKTTLLIQLLLWIKQMAMNMPPVIINDRGALSNLDYTRVMREVEGVRAEDLLGQCIGCGGQDQFVDLVEQKKAEGEELLIVEPTGLFALTELEEIKQRLPGIEFTSVHLIPHTQIQPAISAGFRNLIRCNMIGLTHGRGDLSNEVQILQSATGKPVLVLEKEADPSVIASIWKAFSTEVASPKLSSCQRQCCSHDSHEDSAITTTFSTKGWEVRDLLGYLMTLGSNLIRFKGVVESEGRRLSIEWAHGSWGQAEVDEQAQLKADLFTLQEIATPNRVALTDGTIKLLSDGVPPVLIKSPIPEKFDVLEPVGPVAYELLFGMSARASGEVRSACGKQLILRCQQVAHILLHEDISRLDPKSVDYTRLEVVMVWLWWSCEFGFTLGPDDRQVMENLLGRLDPDQVDLASLSSWMDDDEEDEFLPRTKANFPDHAEKIDRLLARMLIQVS